MKTFITIIIIAIVVGLLLSADVAGAQVSPERAYFMCSVGTGVCPEVEYIKPIVEKPLEVKRAVDTATVESDERIEKMLELIAQLKSLIAQLQALKASR